MNIVLKKYIIGLIIMVSPIALLSHNPLSAKYYLNVSKEVSLLSIHLSQDGVHAMMKKQFGAEASEMQADEYKSSLVKYLKSNCDIMADNNKVVLKQGGIKLGNHQTDVKFIVDMPLVKNKKIKLSIPAFRENEFHQTLFAYNLYGKKDKVILNAGNDYKGEILIGDSSDFQFFKYASLFAVLGCSILIVGKKLIF